MENVFFRDVTIGNVAEAVIEVDFYYEEGPGGPFNPTVRNINVSNVTSKSSKYALYLRGYNDDPIRGITLENCTFDKVAQANRLENVEGLTAVPALPEIADRWRGFACWASIAVATRQLCET